MSETINPVGLHVLRSRYLAKDANGEVCESPDDLFMRVAKAVAGEEHCLIDPFFEMMSNLNFLPNSPTLMNAGTKMSQLSACFVLPIEDNIESIFGTVSRAATIFKTGGGVGLSFSRLRPNGARVASSGGKSSGPVSFMRSFDTMADVVKQGGRRRGAMMSCMRIDHPDILEFIRAKRDLGMLTNMNTSIAVTDEFMQALANDKPYACYNPRTGEEVWQLDARSVFQEIVKSAWWSGEPGMIFIDKINEARPSPHLGKIEGVNPCGESPLLPNESCNLGSINLANMVMCWSPGDSRLFKYQLDLDKLDFTVRLAVRFLDNVIDINKYPDNEIEQNTKRTRKIGLGVMGWAEFLAKLGIPYDAPAAFREVKNVMGKIHDTALDISADIAEEKGSYPALKSSSYPGGLRNATRTSIAPTGSISIIAGVTGGIEPMFAVALKRQNILDNETFIQVNPVFQEIAEHEGFWNDDLLDAISGKTTIQDLDMIPETIRSVFKTAHDVPPYHHVKMQAAFQQYVDLAVSKTVNLSESASEQDVGRIFRLAFDEGCKGITIYRNGSRKDQPMTTETKEEPPKEVYAGHQPSDVPPTHSVRKRPDMLAGSTEKLETGCGTIFVTVNRDEEGKPFEVFAQHGKAGVCSAVQCEALGRLISLGLRSGVDPTNIVKQLAGITCHEQKGLGPNKILSCADAIAKSLKKIIMCSEDVQDSKKPIRTGSCPDCGAALERVGNCVVCTACGYDKCG